MLLFKNLQKKKFQKDYKEAQEAMMRKDLALSAELMKPWSQKGYVEATLYLKKVMQEERMLAKDNGNLKAAREFQRKSVEYMIKAADQGDTKSQFYTGMAYEFPKSYGCRQDYGKAYHYYKLAADKGDGNALNNLGCLYQYGYGVGRDYEKAKELYQKAVDAGNPRGLMAFGYMYKWGKGVPADLYKAKDYMYAAKNMAEEKLYKAKYEDSDLTTISMQENVLEELKNALQSIEKEIEYQENRERNSEAREAIFEEQLKMAQAGDGRAQFEVGLYYQKVKKDCAAAMEWYKKSMEQGFSGAAFNLGGIYYDGWGVKKDYKMAFYYFSKAEKLNGHKYAMKMLGKMYEYGLYVEQDFVKSAEWYEKAAEQGVPEAAGCLGIFYEEGRKGIKKDYEKAAKLFKQGAEAGVMFAEARLGNLYAIGKGVEKDYDKAIELLNKAASKGSKYSANRLEEVYRERQESRMIQ